MIDADEPMSIDEAEDRDADRGDHLREYAEDREADREMERRAADKRRAAEQAVLAAAREYAREWAKFLTGRSHETAEATYAATTKLIHAAERLLFEGAL